MAKDRISFAKRQREVDKKRKADEKRERRAKKKHDHHNAIDENTTTTGTAAEVKPGESPTPNSVQP